jgi:hypothetical protein
MRSTASPTQVRLPFSAEDSPASHSVTLGNGAALTTTVISGRKCLGSYARSGPLGCLVKTLLGSSEWHSIWWRLTWKRAATKLNRSYFRLAASALPISDSGALSWPTPRSYSFDKSHLPGLTSLDVRVRGLYPDNPRYWPTPRATEYKSPKGKTGNRSAEDSHRAGWTLSETAGAGGLLSADWVEWLMVFPVGWTDLGDSATP